MITIGLSSYSMQGAINSGRMDIFQIIDFVAENKGEHIEIVPMGCFVLTGNDALTADIVKHAKDAGIALSSYTIGANFVLDNPEDIRKEIERVKGEIEIAAKLGVKRMRHDAGWMDPASSNKYATYEKYLPVVTEACQELADYAKPYGITTSVENHGYLFQGSERVQRLVLAVNRDNFRTTLDVGNFLCRDEDPVIAAMNNLPFASMIHFKDFYVRKNPPTGEGYFQSSHGRFLRGAITGEGDVDLPAIAKLIQDSDYDGFLSIEYEGAEDCVIACPRALRNVRALFGQE